MAETHWHTLTVTGLHYHNDEACPGHTHPDDHTCDDEIEHELTHPDDCKAEHPCCHQMYSAVAEFLGRPPRPICEACLNGAHDQCASKPPYRCHTEYEVMECYGDNEFPTVRGTYRVRVSGSYDYWGEYDLDIDVEDVEVPAAPTEPATCKREPWPAPAPRPPLSAVVWVPIEEGRA
jgi:hypothetical protein